MRRGPGLPVEYNGATLPKHSIVTLIRRYGLAVYKPKLFIVSRWGLIKTESPYAMDEKLLAKAIAEQVAERADVATTMG